MRSPSNSAPANLAEGWNNKHINIYIEGVNRALGETRETEHHLEISFKKKYLTEDQIKYLITEYGECGRMLRGLLRSLEAKKLSPMTYHLQPTT